ncbi:hypothetical protein [Hahella sp. CCB-MM4]|uniref:hypothetical protein n=1 Tax=Hahella sp. (strain CCB-MM4) TaxID=1926491 RepID=UPI001AEFC845|nr:hypothetical protein [Hahella sp. CCB-MM4]
MSREYTENLEEIATYGFESIDPDETVEVNLKDLMYVFSTLQEYQRFLHQPLHYKTLEDVHRFLGSVSGNAGFKLLHTSIHEKIQSMMPEHINDKFDNGDFDSPKLPFYCNDNR